MKPIDVTFLSIVPSPYQRDLFAALAQRPEVNIRVYYCEAGAPESPWPRTNLEKYEEILPYFHLYWGGSRFIVNFRIPSFATTDVLVLNGYMTMAAQVLARRYTGKVPVLFWGEKMIAGSTGLKGRVQRFLAAPLKKIDGFVAIGKGAVEDYRRRYPGKPVEELPYFTSIAPFRENVPARPRQPITILFCGQMIHRKGVDLLLQAFAELVKEGLPVRLLMVGREAEFPQMLAPHDAATKAAIDFAGFQAPEALPEFFRRADIFVLPSRYDGWGVVVNQAVGAGLPVICSDAVGAARDLVLPGRNGEIYPAEDVARLTEILRHYCRNPEAIRRAGEESLRLAPTLEPAHGAQRWVEIVRSFCPGLA